MITKVEFGGKIYRNKDHATLLQAMVDEGMSVTLCKMEIGGDYMATGVYLGNMKHCITITTPSPWQCLAVVAMVFDKLREDGICPECIE